MKIIDSLQNNGILIFLISIFMVSQLSWANLFNYDDINIRITLVMLLGIICNWLVSKWINNIKLFYS